MLCRDEAGRTLVEMVVILVVIAVLAAISAQGASQLQAALSTSRAKGASDQLAAAIRTTRQRAITNSATHCISMAGSDYEMVVGSLSSPGATTCSGTALPAEDGGGTVTLVQGATVTTQAFEFTPVSTVDPVGPTSVTVTTVGLVTCTAVLTITPGGGVHLPPPTCS